MSKRTSISFPENKIYLLDAIQRNVKLKCLSMKKSEIIVSAIEYYWGTTNLIQLEETIINDYAKGIFEKPKSVTLSFDAILQYELSHKSLADLITYWNISKTELARMFYSFILRLETK